MSRAKPTRLTPSQYKSLHPPATTPIYINHTSSTPSITNTSESLELVYNIRHSTWRLAPTSTLLAPPPPTPRHTTPSEEITNPFTLLSPTIVAPSLRAPSWMQDPSPSTNRKSKTASLHSIRSKRLTATSDASVDMVKPVLRKEDPKMTTKMKIKSPVPVLIVPGNAPPLLCDGKKLIIEIPRWTRKIDFCWRTWNGKKSSVLVREVRLPGWVWWGRNFGARILDGEVVPKWKEVWIERE